MRRLLLAATLALLGLGVTNALAATSPGLGVATSFAVLAGTTVTNTGPTVVSGDLGVSPGSAVTGFAGPPGGSVVNGTIHAADAMAAQAQADVKTAYDNAAGQKPCTDETGKVLGADIGTSATPLPPGVYCFSTSAQITGALYLSGAGAYVFQVGTTLITAPGSSVVLVTASACDVFWQVGSSATLDTTTNFKGTLMALADISVKDGAVIEGRLLARTGQVTLINDTVTRPTCGQSASTTTVVSSANPSTPGQAITFTSTTPGGAGGTVTFYDGITVLGTSPVDSSGQATFTTSGLAPGTHPVTAVFSGTSSLFPSSSPPLVQSVPQAAAPRAPTTQPAPTPAPPRYVVPDMPYTGITSTASWPWMVFGCTALLVGGIALLALGLRRRGSHR